MQRGKAATCKSSLHPEPETAAENAQVNNILEFLEAVSQQVCSNILQQASRLPGCQSKCSGSLQALM
jgi:hypothetical protein